ncbi:hypothetical protein FKQ71_17790 [Vibrio sp. B4-12]|nr:hypothetical protein [Vibrio sp. A14(2019)]MDQ2198467.1 hypothetical protein [Vibrio sp. 2017_1457_11]NNN77576.1 hypothetical protein [Vibrio sp. B7]NNN94366.1 hypothetical protein [Vibrio sp. B8-1]NNO09531.1 hypothetical protein [Vibrio sp. B4-12]
MDDADQKLATSSKPLYDYVRRPTHSIHVTLTVTQNYLQGRFGAGLLPIQRAQSVERASYSSILHLLKVLLVEFV